MATTGTPAAFAKIGRARRHTFELLGAIAQWTTSPWIGQHCDIATDRLSFTVRLDVAAPPPLMEWALLAGDAIHNARSALDVAVYELADVDNLSESQRRAIAFPIVTEVDKWPATAERLAMLPADLLERIRLVQPFQRPPVDRTSDLLPDLRALDDADKHRLPLTAVAMPTNAEHAFAIEFESDPTTQGPPETTVHAPQLVSGSPLLEARTQDRIATVRGTVGLTFRVCIDVPGRGPVGVQEVLEGAALYVHQVVLFLAGGGGSEPVPQTEQTNTSPT